MPRTNRLVRDDLTSPIPNITAKPAPVKAKKTAVAIPPPRVITEEENFPDGTLLCQFTIPGRAATKKTHQQLSWRGGRPRILPSKQYTAYEESCKGICESVWKNQGKSPMDYGVAIVLKVWLNNWVVGDHAGYIQSFGDIFETHGIVANDKFIYWVSGEDHWFAGIDKENPRVEVEIRRYKHPCEEYRKGQEVILARRRESFDTKIKKSKEKNAEAKIDTDIQS